MMATLSDRLVGDPHRTRSKPNILINGGFDFFQRGTDFAAGAVKVTADKWIVSATTEAHQSTDVPDPEAPYSIEVFETVETEGPSLYTSIELINPGNDGAPISPGKQYTLSFWAKRTQSEPFKIQISFVDVVPGVTNNVLVFEAVTTPATAGVWEKFSVTFDIGSLVPRSTNQAVEILFQLENRSAAEHMLFSLVKLEAGTATTSFTRAGNTLAGELALCQRYYQASFMGTGEIISAGLVGSCYGSFPVAMRRPPVITLHSQVKILHGNLGSISNVNSISPPSVTTTLAHIDFNLSLAATLFNQCEVAAENSLMHIDADFNLPAV
jgi:hypothetical protein